ncbi:type VI secretion system baseplate subunit TssG [Pigmentiphaga soli]|uniref:Type VI secretion system baseplate subunit TssG n=1 Tax=Pigmentiphaga soli TaxID=1007095 RepID=A0ABP8HP27_9BURK
MRDQADPVAPACAGAAALHRYLDRVAAAPYRHDLFQVLRTIEALTPELPRLGQAYRIGDEPIRIGQGAALEFAPSPVSRLQRDGDGRPRLEQAVLGLLGPNGPLPLHLTDFVRERVLHHGDRTLARFLDMLAHRQILLFYRAWAQSQPATGLDRPRDDPYARYVGALIGIGLPELRHRDAVPDYLKLHYAGLFNGAARQPENLAAILSGYFRVPVEIQPYIGHWMRIPRRDRLVLRAPPRGIRRHAMGVWPLGGGALLGRTVWDRQHKFRLQAGPLTLAQYEDFLPGGSALPALVAAVRFYLSQELDWDLRLVLKKDDVPRIRLGQAGRLGYTTWLGRRRVNTDADDLMLDADNRVVR